MFLLFKLLYNWFQNYIKSAFEPTVPFSPRHLIYDEDFLNKECL